jgi:hypothetical protein
MYNDDGNAFEHDGNMQAYEKEGKLLIAIVDETYGISEGDDWELNRERFRSKLQDEFGLRFEDGNIGPGADLPAFLTLVTTDIGVPVWTLALSLFFAGKPILDNVEAWPQLAKKLMNFLSRRAFFNRQGSAVVAVDAICRELESPPESLKLLSYQVEHISEQNDISAFDRSDQIADPVPTLYLGFIRHIFEIDVDGLHFRVIVEGSETTVLRISA